MRLPYSLGDIDILVGNFDLTRFYRLPEFIVDPSYQKLVAIEAGENFNNVVKKEKKHGKVQAR